MGLEWATSGPDDSDSHLGSGSGRPILTRHTVTILDLSTSRCGT